MARGRAAEEHFAGETYPTVQQTGHLFEDDSRLAAAS